MGRRTGCEDSAEVMEGFGDSNVDGKARDDRYVDAVKYRSLCHGNFQFRFERD